MELILTLIILCGFSLIISQILSFSRNWKIFEKKLVKIINAFLTLADYDYKKYKIFDIKDIEFLGTAIYGYDACCVNEYLLNNDEQRVFKKFKTIPEKFRNAIRNLEDIEIYVNELPIKKYLIKD